MSLKDSLIHWKKKLQRISDEEMILNTIHKLSKVPITVELLQETGIGSVIRSLAKSSGKIGEKASVVLTRWRSTVSATTKHNTKSSSSSTGGTSNKFSSCISHKVSDSHLHGTHLKKDDSYKDKSESTKSLSDYMAKKSSNVQKNSKLTDYNKTSTFEDETCQRIEKFKNSSTKEIIKDCQKHFDQKKNKSSKSHVSDVYTQKIKKLKTETSEKGDIDVYTDRNEKTSEFKDKQNCLSQLDHDMKKNLGKNKGSKRFNRKISKKYAVDLKKIKSTEAFTSSEVRFEDCLGFNDIVVLKKKKNPKTKPSKKLLNSSEKLEKHGKVKLEKQEKVKKNHSNESPIFKTLKVEKYEENSLLPHNRTTSEVNIISTLPQTQPFYRPLPQRNYDFVPKKKAMSNEDAIKFTSSRKEKTAVYSGKRTQFFYTEVPTLFDSCIRVLIENIDAIEYMGDVPYMLLKTMLERCTAMQLAKIEDYNPYLLEDTNELWEVHCTKEFRNDKPQESETWREVYWRAYDEREKKLKNITANISASMSKSNPVRQVKLAYVDSFVKPPRDVARKQAKNGTAHTKVPVKSPVIQKNAPTSSVPVAAITFKSTNSPPIFAPKKPKVAPLMAKTLKSMKQCFRR